MIRTSVCSVQRRRSCGHALATSGYTLAAFGPLFAGLLRGWTGGFESIALLLALLAAAMAWSGWGVGRKLHVGAGGA